MEDNSVLFDRLLVEVMQEEGGGESLGEESLPGCIVGGHQHLSRVDISQDIFESFFKHSFDSDILVNMGRFK